MEKELSKVPKQTYEFFKKKTPRKTGQARRKTILKGGNTIVANYPYATALDEGHSKQAPKGMTEPTQEYWKALVRKIMRK